MDAFNYLWWINIVNMNANRTLFKDPSPPSWAYALFEWPLRIVFNKNSPKYLINVSRTCLKEYTTAHFGSFRVMDSPLGDELKPSGCDFHGDPEDTAKHYLSNCPTITNRKHLGNYTVTYSPMPLRRDGAFLCQKVNLSCTNNLANI